MEVQIGLCARCFGCGILFFLLLVAGFLVLVSGFRFLITLQIIPVAIHRHISLVTRPSSLLINHSSRNASVVFFFCLISSIMFFTCSMVRSVSFDISSLV